MPPLPTPIRRAADLPPGRGSPPFAGKPHGTRPIPRVARAKATNVRPMNDEWPGMLQVICEVCETSQEPASICVQCGMSLKVASGIALTGDPPLEVMPDLERTSAEFVDEIPMARVAGYERTIEDRIGEVEQVAFVPGFETTSEILLDLFGEDEKLDGIERTTEDFERTARAPRLDGPCPYCGFVQSDGRLCNHCGRAKVRVIAPAVIAARTREPAMVRCRVCGLTVLHERLCSDCGQPLPTLDG